jgi:ketosteroid isomerase-like protein
MTATEAVTQATRALARRFLDAYNDRDLEALRELITGDAQLLEAGGEALRGHDGARALISAAEDANLRLVPFRNGVVKEEEDGRVHIAVPVRELIGPDDVERLAVFEIRDGRIAAFAIRPMPT